MTILEIAKMLEGKFPHAGELTPGEFWPVLSAILPEGFGCDSAGETQTAVFRFGVYAESGKIGVLFLDKDGSVYVEGREPFEALMHKRYQLVMNELAHKRLLSEEIMLESERAQGMMSFGELFCGILHAAEYGPEFGDSRGGSERVVDFIAKSPMVLT